MKIGLGTDITSIARPRVRDSLSIFGSNLLALASAASGVTLDTNTTTTVSALADLAPVPHNFSTGIKSVQPIYTASDATLNNKPTITLDGVNDRLFNTLALPAPGTSPYSFFGVIKVVSATSFGAWMADNSNVGSPALIELTATTVRAQAGSNGGVGNYAAGTWYRFRCDFSNSATDILKIGSAANVTGATGNVSQAGLAIGSAGTQNYANIAFAEIGVVAATPAQMTAYLAQYDAWVASQWPSCQI